MKPAPLYDALHELMGFDKVQKAFERNQLEIAPLAFMRGRTQQCLHHPRRSPQNTTPEQMKMFLTRIGFGSKAVVTGDISQVDLPKGQTSGPGSRAHLEAGTRNARAVHERRCGAPSPWWRIVDAYDAAARASRRSRDAA